jgi:transposase InsO family protein
LWTHLKRDIGINENMLGRWRKELVEEPEQAFSGRVTMHSKHSFPKAENLPRRNFRTDTPNHLWVSDITHIWMKD